MWLGILFNLLVCVIITVPKCKISNIPKLVLGFRKSNSTRIFLNRYDKHKTNSKIITQFHETIQKKFNFIKLYTNGTRSIQGVDSLQ